MKSAFFWIAAVCLAIIPCLCLDIAQHVLDWKKEVREELITVVQNVYSFDRQQKAGILDRVFDRNQQLGFLIYGKSLLVVLLLGFSFYFLRLYRKGQNAGFIRPVFAGVAIMICFILIKIYLINTVNTNRNIKFFSIAANDTSLEIFCRQHFKGKVVYIDFWGTTCGPCLQEFRDFIQPLKERYKARHDLAYLYVAQGSRYLWKQQIKKYKVEGAHLFVNEKQYAQLYKQSGKDSLIFMPRYIIIDKRGNIVETNARQPSDRENLYSQLDKYLSQLEKETAAHLKNQLTVRSSLPAMPSWPSPFLWHFHQY